MPLVNPPDVIEVPILCEYCGGTLIECRCEFVEVFVMDKMEGGVAMGPGYCVQRCLAHDERSR